MPSSSYLINTTPDAKAAWEHAADKEDRTLASWIRRTLNQAAEHNHTLFEDIQKKSADTPAKRQKVAEHRAAIQKTITTTCQTTGLPQTHCLCPNCKTI
jgi:hypothetical protein